MSASVSRMTGARVAAIPCATAQSFPDQPGGFGAPGTTCAPAIAPATAAVASEELSSTTVTLNRPAYRWPTSELTAAPITAASSRAGTITSTSGNSTGVAAVSSGADRQKRP